MHPSIPRRARSFVLSQTNSPGIERVSRLPDNSSFPSKLFEIREIGPTARTGRAVLHFGQPVHHAFFVKGVIALIVGRPNDLFTNFVVAETNGTAVGDRVEDSFTVTLTSVLVLLFLRCLFFPFHLIETLSPISLFAPSTTMPRSPPPRQSSRVASSPSRHVHPSPQAQRKGTSSSPKKVSDSHQKNLDAVKAWKDRYGAKSTNKRYTKFYEEYLQYCSSVHKDQRGDPSTINKERVLDFLYYHAHRPKIPNKKSPAAGAKKGKSSGPRKPSGFRRDLYDQVQKSRGAEDFSALDGLASIDQIYSSILHFCPDDLKWTLQSCQAIKDLKAVVAPRKQIADRAQ